MRLIDADKLIEILKLHREFYVKNEASEKDTAAIRILGSCIEHVKSQKSIEPESVRPHGKIEWKKRTRLETLKVEKDELGTPFLKQKHIDYDAPYCSCCGKRMTGTFLFFCDNCGAKMDGKEDTESAENKTTSFLINRFLKVN